MGNPKYGFPRTHMTVCMSVERFSLEQEGLKSEIRSGMQHSLWIHPIPSPPFPQFLRLPTPCSLPTPTADLLIPFAVSDNGPIVCYKLFWLGCTTGTLVLAARPDHKVGLFVYV